MSLVGTAVVRDLDGNRVMLHYDPMLKESACGNSGAQHPSWLLENQLKQRKMLDYCFLRQRPIYEDIVDFCCRKLRLVIEIDGHSHRNKFGRDQTGGRDSRSLVLWILRFPDRDVKARHGKRFEVHSELD